MQLGPQDYEFAAFVEAHVGELERERNKIADELAAAAMRALCQLAFACGRGTALDEQARRPEPLSAADRHARYSSGIRQAPSGLAREVERQARIKARATR